jgi:GNAT superfamily N-acetyltransferase
MIEAVRRATPADLDALTALQREARDGLVGARGGAALLAEQPPTDFRSAVSDGSTVVFVAAIDEVIVGYMELRIAAAVAQVHQVFVLPEARELGFGDWMMEAAMQVAREESCVTIEGVALPGDRDTKNLYERAGITARKIVLAKAVEP